MNGCVIPGTSIAVDLWQSSRLSGVKFFFLTHLHGDHVVGLSSTWRRPIYCSPLTAQLLSERYSVDSAVLRPLEVDQAHVVAYCNGDCVHNNSDRSVVDVNQRSAVYVGAAAPSGSKKSEAASSTDTLCDSMVVTVLKANHCPGGVMFLFEGSFGKVLHTGDFRYKPEMTQEGSLLYKHVGSIDRLYLDNTYCDPKCDFPSREATFQNIVEICESHPDSDVLFGVRKLGKEELLAVVALALEERINVSPQMLSLASSMGLPDVLTTGQPGLRLRTVPFYEVSSAFVRRINNEKHTIVILPTALYQGICGQPYINQPAVFVVPYSDHSSYPELVKFVSALKPARVVPIVQGKARGPFGVDVSQREDMSCFEPYLSKSKRKSPVKFPMGRRLAEETRFCEDNKRVDCLFSEAERQPQPLKRRRSSQKRPRRKRLCTKGVTYLSDDTDEADNEKHIADIDSDWSADTDTDCVREAGTEDAPAVTFSKETQTPRNLTSSSAVGTEDAPAASKETTVRGARPRVQSAAPRLQAAAPRLQAAAPTIQTPRNLTSSSAVGNKRKICDAALGLAIFTFNSSKSRGKLTDAQRRAKILRTYNRVFGDP